MRPSLAPWAILLLAYTATAQENSWSWNQQDANPNQPLNTDEVTQNFETSMSDLQQAASENIQQNVSDVEKVTAQNTLTKINFNATQLLGRRRNSGLPKAR